MSFDTGHVYFVSNGDNIKIGYTKNEVRKRMRMLQTGNSHKLKGLGFMRGSVESERRLHSRFAAHRVYGEWFKFDNEIRLFIESNCEEWPEDKRVFTDVVESNQDFDMMHIDKSVSAIRRFIGSGGSSKNALAKKAGVPESTLREMERACWNPTLATLRLLEKAIGKKESAR